jgi:fermentation-respiration switch protein FrsA (DUF1100 family)
VRLASLLALLFLAGCGGGFFYPDRVVVDTPERHGIDYQVVPLRAADGTLLNAWFFPARGSAHGTVLYLHGTAQNLSAHFKRIAWLPAAGFNVLALDYRGYGESDGLPSIAGAELDIDAAMRELLARRDIDRDRIFIFGQSLGAALAIYYAAHSRYRENLRAVIADSPFADYRLIATEKVDVPGLAWLARRLVDDRYSPRGAVAALSPIPLLLIHGERDEVIPPHHSKLLFDRAEQPKQFWEIPGAGHIEAIAREPVRERLTHFLLEHCG